MEFSDNQDEEVYGIDPGELGSSCSCNELESLRKEMEGLREEMETVKTCLLQIFSRLEKENGSA